jgi:hypothetical protein
MERKKMNRYFCVLVVLIAGLQNVRMQDDTDMESCDSPNEEYTPCGNLCENSCDNTCDDSMVVTSADLRGDQCEPGCYCKRGYIRNWDSECVKQKAKTCGQGEY